MAKAYRISPRRASGRSGFVASFYDASGCRVNRGLGTTSESEAALICAGLVRLRSLGVASRSAAPLDVPADSIRLYFAESPGAAGSRTRKASGLAGDAASLLAGGALGGGPGSAAELMAGIESSALEREVVSLRARLLDLQRDYDALAAEHAALKRSAFAAAVLAGERAPLIADSLDAFEREMNSRTSAAHARRTVALCRDFAGSLPAECRKVSDIAAPQVSAWITARVDASGGTRKARLRSAISVALGRWLNSVARECGFSSPMASLKSVAAGELARERGAIAWHSIDEMEVMLRGILDPYWRALIAMLGYAGLQLAELAWLRLVDVELRVASAGGATSAHPSPYPLPQGARGTTAPGPRAGSPGGAGDVDAISAAEWVLAGCHGSPVGGLLHVSTVEGDGERHVLKTSHRKRTVQIHSERLLPLLADHLRARGAAGMYLFPALRERDVAGKKERWNVQELSKRLCGRTKNLDRAGRELARVAGLLPAGFSAKSLRRTFGSLLIRSGKSTAEVAAAMGNTEAVVREHYARILGGEVDVKF